MASSSTVAAGSAADAPLALKLQFDESKTGVKGLIDSGITSLPPIFIHPQNPSPTLPGHHSIPTVDLSLPRPDVIRLVASAARYPGFFHVTNHGIPPSVLDGALSAVRSFNELPESTRSSHYSRELRGGFSYCSNYDLFRSAAASWRDTIRLVFAPDPIDVNQVPETCREELLALDERAAPLGRELMGLLAEGLGLEKGKLEGAPNGRRSFACHYYPWCPEPEKAVGTAAHTDPGLLTVLLQDKIGGLQVKLKGEGGEEGWVDVEPVEGALVVNAGDLLQIISNDEYKSVEHRVLANRHKEARISIAVFFGSGKMTESGYYGPLPELVSQEKPALFRSFTMPEYLEVFISNALVSNRMLEHFKM